MALADPKKARFTHVLRDGTVLDSIDGHVVSFEDAEPIYRLIADINNGKVPNKKGGNGMTYDRDAWLKEVIARNEAKTPAERAARLAELNAKLEAGTATAQDKDEIVSMPHPCK